VLPVEVPPLLAKVPLPKVSAAPAAPLTVMPRRESGSS